MSALTKIGVGHVSREMLEHYSDIRFDARRKTLEELDEPLIPSEAQQEREAERVYVTKNLNIRISEGGKL